MVCHGMPARLGQPSLTVGPDGGIPSGLMSTNGETLNAACLQDKRLRWVSLCMQPECVKQANLDLHALHLHHD